MPKPSHRALDAQADAVQLGSHVYEVLPQPIPLLKRDLADYFVRLTALEGTEVNADSVLDLIDGRAYDLLKVFIPDLMPRWEWEGYSTAASLQAGEFDRETARRLAPNPMQVRIAIQVGFRASGLDVWKALGRFVDPTVLRAKATVMLADFLSKRSQNESSAPAPTPSMTSSSPESPTGDDTGGWSEARIDAEASASEAFLSKQHEAAAMSVGYEGGSASSPVDESESSA